MADPVIPSSPLPVRVDADNVDRWIFHAISPYLKGRCLEIKSSSNSLCSFFMEYERPIHLSGDAPSEVQRLQNLYKGNRLVRQVHNFNFKAPDFKQAHPETLDVFDTVIALQVSIPEFAEIVDNIKYVIPQGGFLIGMAPMNTSMYNGIDQNAENWKRYNKKSITFVQTFNFSIVKLRLLNLDADTTKGFFPNTGFSALMILKKN